MRVCVYLCNRIVVTIEIIHAFNFVNCLRLQLNQFIISLNDRPCVYQSCVCYAIVTTYYYNHRTAQHSKCISMHPSDFNSFFYYCHCLRQRLIERRKLYSIVISLCIYVGTKNREEVYFSFRTQRIPTWVAIKWHMVVSYDSQQWIVWKNVR